jgi:hypothetical protein
MIRAALLCLVAGSATAQTPMTGDEFAAYVKGKTLTFAIPGDGNFGVEQYLRDRRVIWSPLDGTCVDGQWYEDKENICFRYEGDPEPKCWRVFQTESGIRAEYASTASQSVLFEAREYPEPLICGDLSS